MRVDAVPERFGIRLIEEQVEAVFAAAKREELERVRVVQQVYALFLELGADLIDARGVFEEALAAFAQRDRQRTDGDEIGAVEMRRVDGFLDRGGVAQHLLVIGADGFGRQAELLEERLVLRVRNLPAVRLHAVVADFADLAERLLVALRCTASCGRRRIPTARRARGAEDAAPKGRRRAAAPRDRRRRRRPAGGASRG